MRHTHLLLWIFALVGLAGCGGADAPLETPVDKAKQLVFERNLDAALQQCQEILQNDPRDVETLLVLEEVHRKLDQRDLAIETCTRAIEASPADPRAYRRRSDLYLAAAEAVDDEDEKWRLRELAIADVEAMKERDPDAQAALAHIRRDPPKVLTRPIPQVEQPKEDAYYKELEAFPDSIDELANDEQSREEAGDEPEAVEQKPAKVAESPQQYAARLAREARSIRDKELGENLEPILPPHDDPEPEPDPVAQEPMTPRPPIARLGLPVLNDGAVVLPQFRGSVATGLRPAPPEADEFEDSQEAGVPTNRFYLQNQFGGMQQGVRTGIGNSRTLTRPTSQTWQLQGGLLPPDARNSFGPRIRQHSQSGTSPDAGGSQPLASPSSPSIPGPALAPNTPILTTALPGTTMLYGTNPNRPTTRYSTAREFPAPAGSVGAAQTQQSRSFGNITDPSFTPFGKRPDGTLLPTLPPQGSNSN